MTTSDIVESFPPKIGQTMFNFELDQLLKSSKDCCVYLCHPTNDPSLKYVTKIAMAREAKKLISEIHCYKDLEGCDGIPRLIFHNRWIESKEVWIEIDWAMIVIEKLFPRFAKTTGRFTTRTLYLNELVRMAVQQMTLLESIHKRGLIHKGIKPDNFVLSEDGSKVYIIDFNKSKRYLLKGSHISYQVDKKPPKGLPLFHSLHYHKGIRSSRRDDMESLGFCWIYLLKGELPWSHIERKDNHWYSYVGEIGECVANTTFEELCEGLPHNSGQYLCEYLRIVRNLKFTEEPNYEKLRQLIAKCLNDSNNDINQ